MEILLVEDSLSDIRLIREAFDILNINHKLNIVTDGLEALEFLNKEGKYKNSSLPSLIILDLNLPKKSGYQILELLKKIPELKHIPVIIFTDVSNQSMKLHRMNANSYLEKPLDFDELTDIIKSIEHFWLKNATLP